MFRTLTEIIKSAYYMCWGLCRQYAPGVLANCMTPYDVWAAVEKKDVA